MGHVYHGEGKHILYDDCARCLEQASDLSQLDRGKLTALLKVSDRGYWDNAPTTAERIAERNIWLNCVLPVERITGQHWRIVLLGREE